MEVCAILAGRVGCVDSVEGCTVSLLAVFARGPPLIYPVQATRLFEAPDLMLGRKALDGCTRTHIHKRGGRKTIQNKCNKFLEKEYETVPLGHKPCNSQTNLYHVSLLSSFDSLRLGAPAHHKASMASGPLSWV